MLCKLKLELDGSCYRSLESREIASRPLLLSADPGSGLNADDKGDSRAALDAVAADEPFQKSHL